jgi:hypothetical protein
MTHSNPWRRRLGNLALLLGSLTVTYLLIEWLLFTLFLHALPLGAHGSGHGSASGARTARLEAPQPSRPGGADEGGRDCALRV